MGASPGPAMSTGASWGRSETGPPGAACGLPPLERSCTLLGGDWSWRGRGEGSGSCSLQVYRGTGMQSTSQSSVQGALGWQPDVGVAFPTTRNA